MMEAHSEKKCAPIYRPEFSELDASRYPRPATIRYQPRTEPAIGMFDTSRPPALKSKGTSHALSKAQIEQAQANRAGNAKIRPHSIATRSIAIMRERNGMTSREIAELTGKQHASVLRDIRVMLSQINGGSPEDYGTENLVKNQQNTVLVSGVSVSQYGTNNAGRAIYHYILDRDNTYCLVAGYDAKARMLIIKRWQELEANAATPALPGFTDPVAAARAWADEVEAKRIAETKVIEMKPKADFHDRATQSEDHLDVGQVAKILRTGPRRLFALLRAEGLLMTTNIPYQPYLNRGLFRVVETPFTDSTGRERISIKTVVTQKGMVFIQGLQDQLAMYQENAPQKIRM